MAVLQRAVPTEWRGAAPVDAPSAIHAWAQAYEQVQVDLGTGDGTFATHVARRRPDTAVIGIDTNLDRLRGARKRQPSNLRFVTADARSWPPGMLPRADVVCVNFPYGSLLRGLVEGTPDLIDRLDALLGCEARIEIRVNESALVANGFDPVGAPEDIASALRRIHGLRVDLRAVDRAALRSFPSSWAKRLGYGRETPAWRIEGRRAR